MDSTCLPDSLVVRDTVIVKDDPFSGRPPRLLPRLLEDRCQSIRALVELAEIDPADLDYVRVFMEGAEVARPMWPHTIARGHVEIAVVPQGGDGDKVLRTLLTIAVVVAAFYVGGATAAAFGLEAGTAGYAAVAGGVAGVASTVGQLAINAILPPPKLSGNYAADPDPVYFINGARNQLALNQPVQTVLGRHRVFPRLLARPYPEIRGEDSYYYVVLDYGPLGVEVSDRKIGDTPIGELDGVEYQERLTASDPHPAMASRQVVPGEPIGATLGVGDWEGRRTASDTVDCDLILLFPQGLGMVNDKGKPRSHSASVKIRYREVIDPGPGETFGPWQFAGAALAGRIPFRGFQDQFTGLESFGGGQLGNFTFTATKPGEPFYRQIGFSFPKEATWDVQVQRASADGEITDRIYDDMRLEQILSKRDAPAVQSDDVAYGVFRLKATDETNGAVDNINMVLGRLIPSFPDAVLDQSDLSGVTAADLSETSVSSNMWEQNLWVARNGFYARRPYADSEIDWPSLAAAAKDARDRGKRFDYVVTNDIDSEALMNMAAFAGEGRIYRYNNILKAHVDGPQPAPTHYFREGTARNISVTLSWPQEVHAFRVTFNDAGDGWRQREVLVYVDGYTKETATRIEPFSLPGKTDWDDLHEALQQQYRNSIAQKELMRCEVPADMVDNTLEPMAWVSVATRVLAQARESGVVREVYTNGSGAVTGLKLDQPVEQGPSFTGLSLKWVRQDEDTKAVFSPAAFLLVVPAEDGLSATVTFQTPLTGTAKPLAGDEYIIGPSSVELFEGLLDKAEDVSDGWLRLYLKSYAPARFDDTGFSVPDYVPGYDLPVNPVPPKPVFELATADERRIIVRFSIPDGFAARISHFLVWRADAPPADDDNPFVYGTFESLPDLPAGARAVVDGARTAGDRVVYRIQAISVDGVGGPVLETGVINAADDIGQPQNVIVTPGTETGPEGASKPIFTVTFTADARLTLLDAVIAIRKVALDGTERLPEGSQPPYDQGFIVDPASGRGVVRGVTAGATYDFRVYFRGRRGEIGEPITLIGKLAPSTDTALAAQQAAVGSALQDALDDADAAITDASQRANTALDDAAAAQGNAVQALAETAANANELVLVATSSASSIERPSRKNWTRNEFGLPGSVSDLGASDLVGDALVLSSEDSRGGPKALVRNDPAHTIEVSAEFDVLNAGDDDYFLRLLLWHMLDDGTQAAGSVTVYDEANSGTGVKRVTRRFRSASAPAADESTQHPATDATQFRISGGAIGGGASFEARLKKLEWRNVTKTLQVEAVAQSAFTATETLTTQYNGLSVAVDDIETGLAGKVSQTDFNQLGVTVGDQGEIIDTYGTRFTTNEAEIDANKAEYTAFNSARASETAANSLSINQANARIDDAEAATSLVQQASVQNGVAIADVIAAAKSVAVADSVVANPEFTFWADGQALPESWSAWTGQGTFTRISTSRYGRYAVRLYSSPGGENGFNQNITCRKGRHTIRLIIEKRAGNYDGSALHINFYNAVGTSRGAYTLPLASSPDIDGVTSANLDGERIFEWEVEGTSADIDRAAFFVMGHWSAGTGQSIASENMFDIYSLDMKPQSKASRNALLAIQTNNEQASLISQAQVAADGAETKAESAIIAGQNNATIIERVRLGRGGDTSVIPDAGFHDPVFWGITPALGQNFSGEGPFPLGTRSIRLGTGYHQFFSEWFEVREGERLRHGMRWWNGFGTFSGWVRVMIHVPGVKWGAVYTHGLTAINPDSAVGDQPGDLITPATSANFTANQDFIVPAGVSRLQFRIIASFTGPAEVYIAPRLDRLVQGAEVATIQDAFIDPSTGQPIARIRQAVAASGSDPAFVTLESADGTSKFGVVASIIRLFNNVGGTTVEVMRAVGGLIFFSNPVSIDRGGKRVTIGPNSDVVLWFGPDTTVPASQTRTNGHFSLGTDGKIRLGSAELGGAATGLNIGVGPASRTDSTNNTSISLGTYAVSVAGGSGSYSYSTTRVQKSVGGTWSIANATSSSPGVSFDPQSSPESGWQAVFRCTVTDTSTGATGYVDFYADVLSTAPPSP